MRGLRSSKSRVIVMQADKESSFMEITHTYHTVHHHCLIVPWRDGKPRDLTQLNRSLFGYLVVTPEPVDELVTEDKNTRVGTHVPIELDHMTGVETLTVTIQILVPCHLYGDIIISSDHQLKALYSLKFSRSEHTCQNDITDARCI